MLFFCSINVQPSYLQVFFISGTQDREINNFSDMNESNLALRFTAYSKLTELELPSVSVTTDSQLQVHGACVAVGIN